MPSLQLPELPKGLALLGLYVTHSKPQGEPRMWVHTVCLGGRPLELSQGKKTSLVFKDV